MFGLDRLPGLGEAVRGDRANLRWLLHALRHRNQSPLDLRQPWMTFTAVAWLSAQIRPDWSVFEYGSGGSTLFFADRVGRVISVEHDEEWAASMQPALATCRDVVEYRLVPPTCGSLAPRISSARYNRPTADFADYVATVRDYPKHSFDLIIVDGRGRVACLEACRDRLKPGGIVVLDNSAREDYAAAFPAFASWEVHHFYGLGLHNRRPWRTTAWQERKCLL